MADLVFPHPEPRREKTRIAPVFLPYAGCPGRCVYCAQELQTGVSPMPLPEAYQRFKSALPEIFSPQSPVRELAFYGGSFTALPDPWPEKFLALAAPFLEQGRITRIRCSTRPDAIRGPQLRALGALGLSLVELGVQSFDDACLAASGRAYDHTLAVRACDTVREAGLSLGLQLMPGLPGAHYASFARDVDIAAGLAPETLRLYPCLVLDGTGLARTWREGRYEPWPLDAALDALATALLKAWAARVKVIRMGLAPEPGLAGKILAGPNHPALGSMARGLALFRHIRGQVRTLGRAPKGLRVPERSMGELWGHAKSLRPAYAGIGLGPDSVTAWAEPFFCLR